jgi:polyphosphate glucokinase
MRTLSIDCGGSGIKGAILNGDGELITPRNRHPVRYPMAPSDFLAVLAQLAAEAGHFDRATVGLPGMIRHGVVITTPHYITEDGPHSTVDPALLRAWSGFNVRAALEELWQRPTIVLNDAQVQGAAAIAGRGYEVMFTLGTGLGCAEFDDGVVQPKLEISRAPVRKGVLYDQWVGAAARQRIGLKKWNRRVERTIEGLRPVFSWDHLYLGGGEAKKVTFRLPDDVTVVPNILGIRGGARVWELAAASSLG